jgi:transposase
MSKRYRVTLTDNEHEALKALIKRRSKKAVPVKRAYILLAADENGEKCWTDEQICETYDVGLRTVERLRQRFVEEGFEVAVGGKKREVFKEKVLDGKVEARLVALRCSESPAGYAKWSLRLLADKMVELEYAEHISHESVRQLLKKTS